MFLLNCFDFKVPRRGQQIYHLLAAEQDITTSKDESVRNGSMKSPAFDVSGAHTEIILRTAPETVRSKVSPEV